MKAEFQFTAHHKKISLVTHLSAERDHDIKKSFLEGAHRKRVGEERYITPPSGDWNKRGKLFA